MNIEKYALILILFLISICCISSSVNAFSIQKLDENTVTYINGKSIITVSIISDNAYSNSKMKKELNNVSKILVKIDGETVNTIKRDKGWNKSKYYPKAMVNSETIVNGKIKGKKVSILTYDKNNKLIKSKTGIVKTVNYLTTSLIKSKNPKFARLTYKQAYESVAKDKDPNYTLKYLGHFYYKGTLQWNFILMNTKTGEGVDFSLSDKDETLAMF